jgi:hypothetical protein
MENVKVNQLLFDVLIGFYEQFLSRNMEPTIDIPDEEIPLIADSSAKKRVFEI